MPVEGGVRITSGWVADGSGAPIQTNRVLEVAQDRIVACRAAEGPLDHPPDVDLSDCLVLPGLIDCHVHLFMSGTADPARREWQLTASFAEMERAIRSHVDQHLASGVAAVRDGGDHAAHTLHFKQSTPKDQAPPLTVHTAGRAWRKAGRYGRLIGRPPAPGLSLACAIERAPEEGDHIKIVNSGLNSLKAFGKETAPQFPLEDLRAAVRTAGVRNKRVMVHVNGREAVRQTIAAGCHSIEHGFFMGSENLQRLADSGLFWVPTACTMQGYGDHAARGSLEADVSRRNLDHQLEQMRRAREFGIKVSVGTDAGTIGVHHGTSVGMEIALFMEAGYTIPEAIQCATSRGAEVLGLDAAGLIAPGGRATLLALKGGPQAFPANLAHPVWFMVDGRVIFDRRSNRR
jgi:imidazolonepropionase-like amidohydrolase